MKKNIIEICSKSKQLTWKEEIFPCNIGSGGVSINKVEGDRCTPIGIFPLREIFYRFDRVNKINTKLKKNQIKKTFKWCDDPNDTNYNKLIVGQYKASCENLWRQDNIYDLIVVIGYNDNPVIPNKGSAIFMHAERQSKSETKGCISLKINHLINIVESLEKKTLIKIT